MGNLPLILMFLGAHPPNPLGWGFAPSTPLFPTPVGLGFASVSGPTRGQVAKVGNSPLLRFCGGHPPRPLPGGFAPLDPPRFCPPSLAWGSPAFWVPLVGRVARGGYSPHLLILGAHPTGPLDPLLIFLAVGVGAYPREPRIRQGPLNSIGGGISFEVFPRLRYNSF